MRGALAAVNRGARDRSEGWAGGGAGAGTFYFETGGAGPLERVDPRTEATIEA